MRAERPVAAESDADQFTARGAATGAAGVGLSRGSGGLSVFAEASAFHLVHSLPDVTAHVSCERNM